MSSHAGTNIYGLDATLAAIAGAAEAPQIFALLRGIAERYHLKSVAYLGTGTLDRRVPRREPYFAVTYSSEWIERYRSRRYLKIDPAIQIGLRRLLPVDWMSLAVAMPAYDGSSAKHANSVSAGGE